MPVYMLVYSGFLYPRFTDLQQLSYVGKSGYQTVFICWGFTLMIDLLFLAKKMRTSPYPIYLNWFRLL